MFSLNLVSGCPRKQIKRRENEALFCFQEGTKDSFQCCLNNDGYAAGSGGRFKTSETPDQQSTADLPWKILPIQEMALDCYLCVIWQCCKIKCVCPDWELVLDVLLLICPTGSHKKTQQLKQLCLFTFVPTDGRTSVISYYYFYLLMLRLSPDSEIRGDWC